MNIVSGGCQLPGNYLDQLKFPKGTGNIFDPLAERLERFKPIRLEELSGQSSASLLAMPKNVLEHL